MNLISLSLDDDFKCQLQFAYIGPKDQPERTGPKRAPEPDKIQCGRTTVGACDRISHDLAVFTAYGRRFTEGTLTFRTLTTEQRYIRKDVCITYITVDGAGLETFILESWQVLGPRVEPAAPRPTDPGWPLRGG
jgi:hypothetical protein